MAVSIGPRIGIDGEAEYRKQIQAIIQETKTLKSEYEKLSSTFDKGHQSLKQNKELHEVLGREIETQERRVKELSNMVELSAQKFGEADPKTQRWQQALNQATTELNNLHRELDSLPNQIELIGQKMEAFGKKAQSIGKYISGIGSKLKPVSIAATGALVGSGKAAIDFETAMVGVQKTIDGTAEDYEKLSKWIQDASTKMASSKSDIAGVMEISGQLGVSGVENLEDFTKTMVMLGDTTNLSSDEAATALARFMNITGTAYKDSDKLGSSIVALGNNFATSESEITEMSTRLAAAGTIAGLSETDILALSAAMTSVGINAEAGGTAMTQTLSAIEKAVAGIGNSSKEVEKADEKVRKTFSSWRDSVATLEKKQLAYSAAVQKSGENSAQAQKALIDVETAERHAMEKAEELSIAQDKLAEVSSGVSDKLSIFASVAGMSADEFTEAWKTKPVEAIQAFITGLGNLDEESESTIALLDTLELSGVRQSNMLQSLGIASEMMGDAVKVSNQAWKENAALQEEADKRYGTTASRLQQAKEKITNVAIQIGERLLPYVDKFLGYLDDLIAKWDALSDDEKDTIIDGLITAAASAPVIKTLGDAIDGVGGAAKGLGKIFEMLGGSGGGSGGIGGKIGGIVTGIGGAITAVTSFVSMLEDGFNWLDEILMVLGAAAAAVGAVILGVPAGIAAAVAAIGAGIGTVVVLIKDHWDEIVQWFGDVVDAIGGFISGLGDTVIQAWDAVVSWFKDACDAIGGFFADMVEGIGKLVSGLGDAVIKIWDGIVNFFKGVVDAIGKFFSGLWDGLKKAFSAVADFFKGVIDKIGGFFSGLVENVKNFFSGMWEKAKSIAGGIKDAFSNCVDGVKGFFSGLVDKVSDVVGDIGDFFSDLAGSALDWGADLIDNFIGGIESMWDSLVDTVSDIGSTIADYLGFSEPEKGPLSNFHTYAPDMMELFAKGIRDNESVVQNQIAKSFDVSGLIGTATIPAEVGTAGNTANTNTVSIGDTRIIINATDGQSAEEIAERVSDIINSRIQMAEAAWA